jgi:hypothetical protein
MIYVTTDRRHRYPRLLSDIPDGDGMGFSGILYPRNEPVIVTGYIIALCTRKVKYFNLKESHIRLNRFPPRSWGGVVLRNMCQIRLIPPIRVEKLHTG